jgi:hypothetical protein
MEKEPAYGVAKSLDQQVMFLFVWRQQRNF